MHACKNVCLKWWKDKVLICMMFWCGSSRITQSEMRAHFFWLVSHRCCNDLSQQLPEVLLYRILPTECHYDVTRTGWKIFTIVNSVVMFLVPLLVGCQTYCKSWIGVGLYILYIYNMPWRPFRLGWRRNDHKREKNTDERTAAGHVIVCRQQCRGVPLVVVTSLSIKTDDAWSRNDWFFGKFWILDSCEKLAASTILNHHHTSCGIYTLFASVFLINWPLIFRS